MLQSTQSTGEAILFITFLNVQQHFLAVARKRERVLASNMDLLIACAPAYQLGERENTQDADQIIIIQ